MGQFISSEGNSNSNDELINSLIRKEYIHTINVEKVFRCVDRGLYYTRDNKVNAYWDRAWQYDKVHLSAPSIYAVVLECLDLHMGHKFLNIGSGVGYFSTVAGLLLGVNGVNHGIELHQSVIDIAYQKLEEFKLNAAGIDYFDLCEPVFIEGNACELTPAGYYDRVYCGAGVPPAEAEFMKSLINIGGVLVMPLDGFLVKITRQSEHIWKRIDVLEVAFSELVVPEKCSLNTVKFPSVEPLSLQELCRSKIRATIRDQLNESFPFLKMRVKCNLNMNREEILFNAGDPLTEYIRLQYGISENGMVNIQNIVDAFAVLDDAVSDIASTSENEANEEEDNDDNNSDPVDAGEKTCELCDEKKTKRTSSEAGCSEQNKTLPEKTENSKRMRMNTSSTVRHTTIGQSSSSRSGLWETISSNSSEIDNDSGSWVSSINTEDLEDDDDFNGNYDSLFNDDSSHDSDTDSEVARESVMFSFLSKRKENELSKLMKSKIELLPIPTILKLFLNYDKKD